MNTKLIMITILLSVCIFNCATEKPSLLEGTWKPISSIEIWGDSTITLSAIELSGHAKIFNKTHFATLSNGSTRIPSFFNGGKYDLTEDTYTEHIEYWLTDTTTTYIGNSFTFESKIEGDQWTMSGPIEKVGENPTPWKVREVYKRVD